ncbi:receptor-like protein kinase FERONIA [Alnus glutinosa]|uniref:receptor-like protein kinase FERONIA n=1 Tax=Alnus glutinosa TaxID=3517 RepID=UPI002D77E95D|nr:receptor-like protein kinase FERONIA [Alnus glutinosa]
MRSADKKQVSLAKWARQSHRNGKMDQIVDPTLKGEIAPECLKKYCEIVVNCLLDNEIERPSMNDVVWGLEFALQLQESDNNDVGLDGELEIEKKSDEKTLLPKSKIDDSNDSIDWFSSSGIQVSTINSNCSSSGEQSSRRLVVAVEIQAD